MRTMLLGGLAAALLVPPAHGAGDGIHFFGSYEQAFAEANARGVPVLLFVIQDDEEANDDVWYNTLQDEAIVRATRRTVNVIGNRGDEEHHGVRVVEVDGKERRVCAKFGSVNCLEHKKCEAGIFRDFARDGMLKTPMVIVALPDQSIVATLVDRNPVEAYLEAIAEAERRLPGGLDEREARRLRENLAHARAWLEEGAVEKIIAFAAPLREHKSSSSLVRQALLLLEEVEKRGRSEIERVEELLAGKRYAEAVERLEEIRGRYRGCAVEKVAGARLARLKRNPKVRAALTAAKREEAARRLLEQADTWKEKGKEERAAKLYRRLLERFGDTKAAARLRARSGKEATPPQEGGGTGPSEDPPGARMFGSC